MNGTPDAPVVLVLKPSSLGDIIHTLPAVARFRRARPGWWVRWLVNDEFDPLLENNPAVDEVVRFPRQTFRGAAAPWRVARWLRREWRPLKPRPDLALDFQGLLRSALLGRISGAPVLHGLDDAREGATRFYHRVAATPPGPVHAVHRYLALVDAATGAAPDPGKPVEFPLPAGEPWPEPLPAGGFVVLHPFARGMGKSLDAAQVRALGAALVPRPVLVVGRGGGPLTGLPGNVRDLRDRTSLPQLIWLLRRAAFVVSVDSGPMHLAAAALTDPGRLLSLHSWSDPRRVGPFPPAAWVWQSGRGLRQVGELVAGEPAIPGPLLPDPADVHAVVALVARGSGL